MTFTKKKVPNKIRMIFEGLLEVFISRFFFLLFGLWGYWHCEHFWPFVPASGDTEDDCGEGDGM
jgi:hypothetical protein